MRVAVLFACSACGRIGFGQETPRGGDASITCFPAAELAAGYAFEGDPSSAGDASPNGNTGTCDSPATCPTSTTGVRGQALQFTAAQSTRIRVRGSAPSLELANGYTVSLYVRRDDDVQSTYVAKLGGTATKESFQLMQETAGTWAFSSLHAAEHDLRAPITTLIGAWTHFVLTWDAASGTKRLFVDATLVASAMGVGPAVFDAGDMMLGADPDMPVDSFFTGAIDEVVIVPWAASESDVVVIADCPLE